MVSRLSRVDAHITGIPGIIGGILLFSTATTVEKSIGKILVSLLSVVVSIGGCYRFQKRGAVSFVGTMPIFAMLFTSVLGRVAAFAAFFSTKAPFEIWMPIFYLVHTSVVLAIKMMSQKKCGQDTSLEEGENDDSVDGVSTEAGNHNQAQSSWYKSQRVKDFLIDLVGAAASFLVFVNIKSKDQKSSSGGTFYLHSCYFILILIENILMASSPLMVGSYKYYTLLGETIFFALPFIILALWVLSCLCMVFFYKVYGHPWTALNGPEEIFEKTKQCKELCFCCKKDTTADNNMQLTEMGGATTKPINEIAPDFTPQDPVQVRVLLMRFLIGGKHDIVFWYNNYLIHLTFSSYILESLRRQMHYLVIPLNLY